MFFILLFLFTITFVYASSYPFLQPITKHRLLREEDDECSTYSLLYNTSIVTCNYTHVDMEAFQTYVTQRHTHAPIIHVHTRDGKGIVATLPSLTNKHVFIHLTPSIISRDTYLALYVDTRVFAQNEKNEEGDVITFYDELQDTWRVMKSPQKKKVIVHHHDPHCARGRRSPDGMFCCTRRVSTLVCEGQQYKHGDRSCLTHNAPCSLLVTQTVTVAYTALVKRAYPDLQERIALAIAETNQGYKQSRIPIHLVLQTTYEHPSITDGVDSYTLLTSFRGSSTEGANMAVLLSASISSCGRAYLDCAAPGITFPCAYAVVNINCATGYYSFGHELGHIQGADHNLPFMSSPYSRFPYNHGYIIQEGYAEDGASRTVMAYNVVDETRVLYWSDPTSLYQGKVTGQGGVANNVRVLSTTRYAIASLGNNV